MRTKLLLSILFFISISGKTKAIPAEGGDSLYFFNSNLLFIPTEASIFESKNGVTKYFDTKNLKLDIGATIDLIGLKHGEKEYSFGADFFTFSNLRSESNFKFPVDAIDYMFGINFNMRLKQNEKWKMSYRLRISHISSHFEDGHIYERTDTIFTPVVFSKEFFDLAAVSDYKLGEGFYLKNLLALNYVFHSIPEDASGFSGQIGIETKYFFTKIFSAYLSSDFVLAEVNSNTNLNLNIETGLSLGRVNSRALMLYFSYYDGQDYRGQYYGKYLNNHGIGLRIKF
ncbi:MAG: hypothetical protein HGGPFJEG_00280 [Ignavibacteria bacterium]|nr:hypothetical protein [Ignavibacteria bacterium]